MFRRGGAGFLSMVLLLGLSAPCGAVKSNLRANVNKGESAQQLVTDAMNSGVMLMSKLMAQQADADGPQPSKASMDLEEKANNLLYSAYGRLNLARTSAEAALELIQMDDQKRWDSANQNYQEALELQKQGNDQFREGQKALNQAYAGSPDVDPNAKVWSETGSMLRRARNLGQQVQSTISRLKRKSPKGFQLLQVKTTTGFKEAAEKKMEVKKDTEEDSLVSFVESYKFM